jgi:hypothetical protein
MKMIDITGSVYYDEFIHPPGVFGTYFLVNQAY